MKNKLIKINMFIIFIVLSAFFILFILGRIERIGYLSSISLNVEETLKNNSLYTNDLEINDIKGYILTNDMLTNYVYNFRISYYSKIFRNSDIYGVYLNTNSLPNYITEIKFQKKGSPFGIITSDREILENIDNVKYNLKLKFSILIIIFLFIIFIFILTPVILDLIYFIKIRINFRNRYSYILILFLSFLIMPNIIYKAFYDKFDHFNYEYRTYAIKPKFTIKYLKIYPQLYESYFNDYLALKNELVKLKNLIDIFIFNNIINRFVLLGNNGWHIYYNKRYNMDKDFMGEYFYTNKEMEKVASTLIKLRDYLKNKNIDFIFFIAPNKNRIYPEKLPNYIKKRGKINSVDILVKYIL